MSSSLTVSIAFFLLGAFLIGVFGVRMTHLARELAHTTGLGEAMMGAFFIGGATSLSGIVTTVTAAVEGHPEMAVSNALGGIAAQTAFLAIADSVYRRANLEHAAASAENLMMCAFLIMLLAIPLVAFAVPEPSFLGIHPLSLVLVAAYAFGIRLLARTHAMPMWIPRRTSETRSEHKSSPAGRRKDSRRPWFSFLLCAAVVAVAGWLLTQAAIVIAAETELSEGLVGGVFTAVSTSLPELVIAVTAVRMKSLTLAVGDIIGGNGFDTLFIAMSDIAYRDGSIYAAITANELYWLAISLLMTGILLMGLLHRERHGIANIGLESVLILLLYAVSLVHMAT
jgi:cation:H+ antiporter